MWVLIFVISQARPPELIFMVLNFATTVLAGVQNHDRYICTCTFDEISEKEKVERWRAKYLPAARTVSVLVLCDSDLLATLNS